MNISSWHTSSGSMQDFPMKDSSECTVSYNDESIITGPRKLSRILSKSELPPTSNSMLPTSSSISPILPNKKKSKPTPLSLPVSNHSFMSIFSSGKEVQKEVEEEVSSTSRFRLKYKKSKLDLSVRSEAELLPQSPEITSNNSLSTAELVSFKMSRARSHNSVKSIEESTSSKFRALFPPIPQASPAQLYTNTIPTSPINIIPNSIPYLLPAVSIEDKMDIIENSPSLPSTSPRSIGTPKIYQPTTPRSRNQSYPENFNSSNRILESPIRVIPIPFSTRQRSKSVSTPSSNKPKFVEDAFYSPGFFNHSPQPSLSPTSTSNNNSNPSIDVSVKGIGGIEISSSSCAVEDGVTISIKSSQRPDQFEVNWTCTPGIDSEGKSFTQWELQLKPKNIGITSLFSSDYRLSQASNSSPLTPKTLFSLTSPIDQAGLRSSSDFLNGPYTSSLRKPSTITASRKFSIGAADSIKLSEQLRDNVEIVGSLPKNFGRSNSGSADGIETYQQRSSSISIKSATSSVQSSSFPTSTSPKSPKSHRFGRYMPMESNILLRKDLKSVIPLSSYSPSSLDSLDFVNLHPTTGSSKSSPNLSSPTTVSSSSSSSSFDATLANNKKEIKSSRKSTRGRSNFSDTENENDEEEFLGIGKTSWSEVKDCEEDY